MITKLLTAVILVAALTPPLSAQDEKPEHLLRILPVGKAPPMRIQIQGGVRREVDPPRTSIPPRNIHVLTDQVDVESNLKLGQCSTPVALRFKEKRGVILSPAAAPEEGEQAEVWAKFSLPKSNQSLAILFRAPDAKTWDHPKSLLLSDTRKDFPGGSIRFINTSPVILWVKVGSKAPFPLGPGKSSLSPSLTGTADVPVHLVVRDKNGNNMNVLRTTVNLDPTRRANLIAFWAKPDHSRRPPVQTTLIRDKVPPLPTTR
jgi:hypothetical protein